MSQVTIGAGRISNVAASSSRATRGNLLRNSAIGFGLSMAILKPGEALAQQVCGPAAATVTCTPGSYTAVGYNGLTTDTTIVLEPGVVLTEGMSATSANGAAGVDITVDATNATVNRTISTPNYFAAGIVVGTSNGLSGPAVANAGTITIRAGDVDVSANNGKGILAYGNDITITANSVIARGASDTSPGATQSHAVVADSVGTGGDIYINVGTTSAAGDNASAILAYSNHAGTSGAITIISGDAFTSGRNAPSVLGASHLGNVSVTSGTSITTGDLSDAVVGFSGATGNIEVSSVYAVTNGVGSRGVAGSGIGGDISLVSGYASTSGGTTLTGRRAIAVIANASNATNRNGDVTITSEEIEYSGGGAIGIYAAATDGDIVINTGSIVGNGENYYADTGLGGTGLNYVPIALATDSVTGNVTINSESIINNGTIGGGIGVNTTSGLITVNTGYIETFGDGGLGITTTGATGDVVITSDDITTHGDALYLPDVDGAYNGRELFFADAIEAASRGGSVTVTSNDATVLGEGNQAITIIAFEDATLNSRNATNMGEGMNAIGVVMDNGLMDINLTGATTAENGTGASLIALNESDVTVDLSAGASILARDGGLLAVTGTGSTTITNRGRIETTGADIGSATGAAIQVSATTGGSVTINNYGTIIGGLSQSGVVGSAITFSDDVVDETLNLFTGSIIVGSVDGQGGVDTLNLSGTVNAITSSQGVGDIVNFEVLNVDAGYWVQSGQVDVAEINANAGALILTGAASGDATIEDGAILQIGAGGTTGTLVGDIIANGTLVFNRSDDYLFAGALSGDGSLVKLGAGKVTLDGLYSFSGTTSIQAGTLKITQLAAEGDLNLGDEGEIDLSGGEQTVGGLNGSSGSTVNIDEGELTINQEEGATSTFGGSLTGNGSLIIAGGGSINLTGVNTYTGPTSVEGGKLSVNGSITSAVTVNDGSILGGSGTINGSILIRRNATLAPGNSPGILNVGGPLTLSSGSTLQIEVNPSLSPVNDRIDATGVVTIENGAILEVDPQGSIDLYQRANEYTIINADGGIVGTFAESDVSSNMALLDPRLVYEPSRLRLQLIRNDIAFNALAQNTNQFAIGTAAEAAGDGAPVYNALVAQSDAGLRAGYDALSGEVHGSASTVLINEASNYRRQILERMSNLAGNQIWLEATAEESTIEKDTTKGYGEVDSNSAGMTGGGQLSFGALSIGASGAYIRSDIDVDARSSDVTAESTRGTVFATFDSGVIKAKLGAEMSESKLTTARAIVFPGVAQASFAEYDASESQVFGEIAFKSDIAGLAFEPFVGIAKMKLETDGFEEDGVLGLEVDGTEREVTFTTVGARLQGPADWQFRPMASAAWRHAEGDRAGDFNGAFTSGSPDFLVSGATVDSDSLLVDAGFSYAIGPAMELSVGYSGVIAPDTRQDYLNTRFSARF
ncbi:MAG: autotransporter domain-containing protein [Hyphomonadaceae bacterium]|nr:autotransporter domain-containing protein [Hyphomonadaceae bacterium]